jgi:hypothetical protein
MDRNDRRKLAKAWPALGALGLAFTLGATAAAAQTGRGWVDPPANLKPPQNAAPSSGPAETVTNPPAPKAETPTPAKAAASEKACGGREAGDRRETCAREACGRRETRA